MKEHITYERKSINVFPYFKLEPLLSCLFIFFSVHLKLNNSFSETDKKGLNKRKQHFRHFACEFTDLIDLQNNCKKSVLDF